MQYLFREQSTVRVPATLPPCQAELTQARERERERERESRRAERKGEKQKRWREQGTAQAPSLPHHLTEERQRGGW